MKSYFMEQPKIDYKAVFLSITSIKEEQKPMKFVVFKPVFNLF